MPANKAAMAAGYAKCVSEHNAMDILRSNGVARYIERHRAATALITVEAMAPVIQGLLTMAVSGGTEQIKIQAIRELRSFLKVLRIAQHQVSNF
jgi:phage terminase small subunit